MHTQETQDKSSKYGGPNVYQALGLFLLTNVVILLHGAVRVVFFAVQAGNNFGSTNLRGLEQFPPGLQVAAAFGEVGFSTYGLLIALAGIMGDLELVKRHIKPCVAISIIFGWFAFLVFALGAEIYNINNNEADLPAVAGLIGILAYCGSMIGAQAFFAVQLLKILGGEGHIYTANYFSKRALYYNFLLFLVGVTCLLVGGYAIQETGMSGLVVSDAQIVTAYGGPAVNHNYTMGYDNDGNAGGSNPEGGGAEGGGAEGGGAEGGGAEGRRMQGAGAEGGGAEDGGNAEGGGAEGGGAEGGGAEGGAQGGNPEGSAVNTGRFPFLVQAPPFFVIVPALNVLIGLAIMLLAIWGVIRAVVGGSLITIESSMPSWDSGSIDMFGYVSALVFVLHIGYVALAGPAYVKSIAAGVQIAALAICLHFMPVYLDCKMRALPLAVEAATSKEVVIEEGAPIVF